jgi:hypothetical protein
VVNGAALYCEAVSTVNCGVNESPTYPQHLERRVR